MIGVLQRSSRRIALRCSFGIKGRPAPRECPMSSRPLLVLPLRRSLHEQAEPLRELPLGDISSASPVKIKASDFSQAFDFPPPNHEEKFSAGAEVTVHGFLGRRRNKGIKLIYCELLMEKGYTLQIVSQLNGSDDSAAQIAAHAHFKALPSYSAVSITGILSHNPRRAETVAKGLYKTSDSRLWDLNLLSAQCLNPFPADIIVSKGAVFPATARHLQLRFDPLLRARLAFRSQITLVVRKFLQHAGFDEIETPILFKSTPEGAREFIVPTRRAGQAYALPQSPQQYKQILMAGGLRKYFQLARCFRDEDHRADRQPEFTQLDLEMAFATGQDVRTMVERIIRTILRYMSSRLVAAKVNTTNQPVNYQGAKELETLGNFAHLEGNPDQYYRKEHPFPVLSYREAMSMYGIDKPDLRIRSALLRIEHFLPKGFVRMITKLENPIVEAAQFYLQGSIEDIHTFIRRFMEDLPKTTLDPKTAGGTPGVFVFNETKPMNGLSPLGHEAATQLAETSGKLWDTLRQGHVVIIHAREDKPFQGEGSTEMGRLRKALFDAAVSSRLIKIEPRNAFKFLWVDEFPLFTPNSPANLAAGEGQGGAAGFSATHHPFTAPLRAHDFELLETDPLAATADHYDLVCNGTEVGGGSRRIHIAALQEHILRDILKMPSEGIEQFRHLLDALRSGCPPHAGFALGFDRLIALLCGTNSVRDVIAFPKTMKGDDAFVKAPSLMTESQLQTYHIDAKGWVPAPDSKAREPEAPEETLDVGGKGE